MRWDVPASSSQHKPCEGASCSWLGFANEQMRCLIEASSTSGRSTSGSCQTVSVFVLAWEMGQHLCKATNLLCVPWGDGNYGQAFAFRGARSCVMLCECTRVACASDPVSAGLQHPRLCGIERERQNWCQQKLFLLNWYFKIVTRDP